MHVIRFTAVALAATLALGAATISDAQGHYYYHHHHRYYARDARYDGRYDRGCEESRRRAANTGTLIGGIGGALVGNAIGGGHLGGTLIGGGVGAVAGHQIASNNHNC